MNLIMKYRKIILAGLLLVGLAACEKKLPVYESSVAQLNFQYGTNAGLLTDGMTEEMSKISHSFIMDSKPNQEVDTVWVTVLTMGYLSDQDRPFELQQVMTGNRDAVAGVHYVAFDSPEMQDWYVIPAGESFRQIPIVVMRDPSLAEGG